MNGNAASADSISAQEAEADRAAARGDHAGARRLLEQVTASNPDCVDPWLKLAAMCRAQRDLPRALAAVSAALRVEPLGFLPLLLKANLLEASGKTIEAGEAYGHALAQRPEHVPPHLSAAIAQAEVRQSAHLARLADELAAISASVAAPLSQAEQARVARFRSNIMRTTRPYHSEPTHFHYPGLVEREFHDRADFPWLEALEAAAGEIAREFEAVMAAERAELVPYIQYPEDQPLRQWKELNHSRAWTAIHLLQNGRRVEANVRHCPNTMRVLEQIDQPEVAGKSPNAMFSLLAPGTRIPPHNGVANTRLVCHLPLIVPEKCWFRVGAETREWKAGEAFVFDDTIEHEAANDSGQLRVVFICDVWHPGLSAAEREVVAALMAGQAGVDTAL
jgi:aspartyl/asparaginyl beta-hydroxylase (cupin superfamily)